MPFRTPHFPDTFIGFLPDLLQVFQQGSLQFNGRLILRQLALPRLMQSVGELAVDVQLLLSERGVPDANR